MLNLDGLSCTWIIPTDNIKIEYIKYMKISNIDYILDNR